jgi:hypothetical protein
MTMSETTTQPTELAKAHPKPFPRSIISGSQAYLVAFWVLLVFALAAAYAVDKL